MNATMVAARRRDEAYFDIFITALEGGINYWAACNEYRWMLQGADPTQPFDDIQDVTGFRAVIFDHEDGDKDTATGDDLKVIDRAAIARGVSKYVEWAKDHTQPYLKRAAIDLRDGNWDDLDVDATIADCIVQFAIFGEVVFG